MLGEIVGDPVALTYEFVELAAADPAMSASEMRARATELAEAGCSECASIVSDAANSMG